MHIQGSLCELSGFKRKKAHEVGMEKQGAPEIGEVLVLGRKGNGLIKMSYIHIWNPKRKKCSNAASCIIIINKTCDITILWNRTF